MLRAVIILKQLLNCLILVTKVMRIHVEILESTENITNVKRNVL